MYKAGVSLIGPTAYAEAKPEGRGQRSDVSTQTPDIRGQRSDVRLNHARSVKLATRNSKLATNNAPLMPVPCSNTSTHICVDIGTLHPGDSVQISFSATVNNPPNLTTLNPPSVTTQGTVSGGNFSNVLTDDQPGTAAPNEPTITPIDLFDVAVALGSDNNPNNPTDPVTYTATITIDTAVQTPLVGTTPTTGVDTVTFKDNNVAIGTCTNVVISGSGPWTAQCTIPGGTYAGGSSHPITATYNGDGNFDPKTSSTLTQNVNNCVALATVTNTGDNLGVNPAVGAGTGTLRQAIVDACPGSTINFNIPGGGPDTITLSAELALTKNVTITGPTNKTTIVNGGGVARIFNVSSGKTATISSLNLTGGNGSLGNGGANFNAGTPNLLLMAVYPNTATGQNGGGIFNDTTGTLRIINSTLSGNSATLGGGVYNDRTLTITNSTISGNTATNVGGGVYLHTPHTMTFNNTIVAGNTNDDLEGAGADMAGDYNLIGGTTGITGPLPGTNNIVNPAPGLGALAFNGGPTQTMALQPNSPAIDAGNNTLAV